MALDMHISVGAFLSLKYYGCPTPTPVKNSCYLAFEAHKYLNSLPHDFKICQQDNAEGRGRAFCWLHKNPFTFGQVIRSLISPFPDCVFVQHSWFWQGIKHPGSYSALHM